MGRPIVAPYVDRSHEAPRPKVHELKTENPYFWHLSTQSKNFEIRKEDGRNFQMGDHLLLQQWHPTKDNGIKGYTGKWVLAKVTYVTTYGQQADTVVMGLEFLDQGDRI